MASYKKIVIEKAVPMLNFVYVTSERISAEESAALNGGIISAAQTNQLKSLQRVIAVSPSIVNSAIKEGDLVEINIESYGMPIQKREARQSVNELDEHYGASISYRVPIVEIDGVEYLKLKYTEIDAIITEYREEEIEEKKIPIIQVPDTPEVIIEDKKILLN